MADLIIIPPNCVIRADIDKEIIQNIATIDIKNNYIHQPLWN